MLPNYVKFAVRLLIRNTSFTLVNVSGLSLGFAVFFILWQYSWREFQTDRFIKDYERIYRVIWFAQGVYSDTMDDAWYMTGTLPGIVADAYENRSQIESYTHFVKQSGFNPKFIGDHGRDIHLSTINEKGEKQGFVEEKIIYAKANLFSFFGIKLLRGDEWSVLGEKNSMVLSASAAMKYFGTLNAVGKLLFLNDKIAMEVTGVFQDLPSNSHLDFDVVLSLKRIESNLTDRDLSKESWVFMEYVKLTPSTDMDLVTASLAESLKKLYAKQFERWDWNVDRLLVRLQPFQNIAFEIHRTDDFAPRSKFLIGVFQSAAFVILGMAWVNYVNLSIGRNKRRQKELGTRTAIGAQPQDVIIQYLVEALLMNMISMAVAITIYQIMREPLTTLAGFSLPAISEIPGVTVLMVIPVCLGGVVLTGLYPAFMVLRMMHRRISIVSLHGERRSGPGNWLLVAQFAAAIIFVTWIFGVSGQVEYVINKTVGSARDNVVVVDLPHFRDSTFDQNLQTFLNELSMVPGVEDFAVSSSVPGENDPNGIGLQLPNSSEFLGFGTNGGVDDRFIPFNSLVLLAGRNFMKENPADRRSIVVSRIAARRLGANNPADAIGMRVLIEQGAWTHNMVPCEIIGVIEDYTRFPLFSTSKGNWGHERGLVLSYGNTLELENIPKKISIRVNHSSIQSTIPALKSAFEKHFQEALFVWRFLDHLLKKHYEYEKRASNQIIIFTMIAIAIASIGFIGMVSNTAVEKIKEIGVRKVLGASLTDIWKVLLNKWIWPTCAAAVIGIPIAYYLINEYFQRFSEHIQLQWWHFAFPFVLLVCILLSTTSWVVMRAARINPVDSLRHE